MDHFSVLFRYPVLITTLTGLYLLEVTEIEETIKTDILDREGSTIKVAATKDLVVTMAFRMEEGSREDIKIRLCNNIRVFNPCTIHNINPAILSLVIHIRIATLSPSNNQLRILSR